MSLIVVAKKEFADQVTSKRFIAIFVIMLLFTAYSIYQGADTFMRHYHSFVESGKSKPSIIQIFSFLGSFGISTFGAILGLLMGFDLITREKETGSLKTLLSHPVFRDQIINGKALGAFMALCLVVIITLVASLGVLVMKGFTPSFDDLVSIAKFGLITLAYLFTFFSIALFASTTAKNSGTALLIAFGVFLLLTLIVPMIGSLIANAIVGSPPDISPPPPPISKNGSMSVKDIEKSPEWQEYRQKMDEYWEKRRAIKSFFNILSPSSNYLTIVNSLSQPSGKVIMPFQSKDVTKNIVGFVILPIIFFVLSYIRFLRMEIT